MEIQEGNKPWRRITAESFKGGPRIQLGIPHVSYRNFSRWPSVRVANDTSHGSFVGPALWETLGSNPTNNAATVADESVFSTRTR
jgi:hypothetical protein